jgi:HPt (histidine-containing phosphotransfer) domain-containing protein
MVEMLTEEELGPEALGPADERAAGAPAPEGREAREPDPGKVAVVADDASLLQAVEAAEADADGAHGWHEPGQAQAGGPLESGLGDRPPAFESTNAAALLGSRDEGATPAFSAVADAGPTAAKPESDLHALSSADVLPLYEWGGLESLADGETRPPIDRDRLEQTCMGIPSLRETVINAFLTEVRPRLEKLSQALSEHDGHQAEFEAHGLKGMCATLGAAVCAEKFAELERLCRERTLEGAPRLLKQAYLEVTRTEQFLSGADWDRKAA